MIGPFRFGLRRMLITISVIGVSIGLLGRFYVTYPETLFMVLPLLILAFGMLPIFALHRSRRKISAWVAVPLGMLPIVVAPATIYLRSTGQMRYLPTSYLVDKKITAEYRNNAAWNELTRRLIAGKLNESQVERAFQKLTAIYERDNFAPLDLYTVSSQFTIAADARGMVNQQDLIEHADAVYPKPFGRLHFSKQQNQTWLSVVYGAAPYGSGCPLMLIWCPKRVSIDGREIESFRIENADRYTAGCFEGVLPPDVREVSIELECAYVKRDALPVTKGGRLRKEAWPSTVQKEWTIAVHVPVE